MDFGIIDEIRILPNSKKVFPELKDFKFFIEDTMVKRGGKYFFPGLMLRCSLNTLVLFQYDGAIRAIGVLLKAVKEESYDEIGNEYCGYYIFDNFYFLDKPLDYNTMKKIYPQFRAFNQCKQIIPIDCLNELIMYL